MNVFQYNHSNLYFNVYFKHLVLQKSEAPVYVLCYIFMLLYVVCAINSGMLMKSW